MKFKTKRPKRGERLLTFGHVKAFDKETDSVRFRFTEKKIDRYDEVVLPGGANLKEYATNPVALWAYGWGSQGNIPIGRTLMETVEKTDEYLDANIKFDDKGEDEFATMISDKVKNGFLKACSIGFMPTKVSENPAIEGQRGLTHVKWDLLEISVCAIGALPSALVTNAFDEFNQYRLDCIKKFGKDEVDKIFNEEFIMYNKTENLIDIISDADEMIEEKISKNPNYMNDIFLLQLEIDLLRMKHILRRTKNG